MLGFRNKNGEMRENDIEAMEEVNDDGGQKKEEGKRGGDRGGGHNRRLMKEEIEGEGRENAIHNKE